MSKEKFYLIVICFLIVINLIFITFFINQNNSSKNKGPRNFIIESLSFDKYQIKKYDLLIEEHRFTVKKSKMKLNNTRKLYFQSSNDSIALVLSNLYMSLEKVHKNHINDIFNLCSPTQKKEFHSLIEKNNLFHIKTKK